MENSAQLTAIKYKTIFSLETEDVLNVQNASSIIMKEMEAAFSELYTWIDSQCDLKNLFTVSVFNYIEKNKKDTWLDLVQANVDEQYIRRQRNFAQFFQKSGIPSITYLSFLSAFQKVIKSIYVWHNLDTTALLCSFKKVAAINISLAMDFYTEAANLIVHEQQAERV